MFVCDVGRVGKLYTRSVMASSTRAGVAYYQRSVGRDRDDDIEAIVELGRRTRRSLPRGLWIASLVVAAVCAIGFAVVMVSEREAPGAVVSPQVERRPVTGPGLGIGLVIGAGCGIVIGFSIGRQRRSHSSRNSP